MITRIVQLHLQESKIEEFKTFVLQRIHLIRRVEGCITVDFFQDHNHKNIFYTISKWKDMDALNSYRKSELFGDIWPVVKDWFSEPAHAHSLNTLSGEEDSEKV